MRIVLLSLAFAVMAWTALLVTALYAAVDSKVMERGAKVYKAYCLACHQANGQGIPNIYPPLAKSDWLKNQSKEKAIETVVFGLRGPIAVNGKKYNGVMNPIPSNYTHEDIAAVITYVYNSWGNPGTIVTADDVAKVRAAKGKKK